MPKIFADALISVDEVLPPRRQTKGSAGYDIYSPTDYNIKPHSLELIDTKMKIMIPTNHFVMIVSRSSMALKRGLITPNSPAIIDSDYQDNIIVGLFNTTDTTIHIKKGERIAQFIFFKEAQVRISLATTSLIQSLNKKKQTIRKGGIRSTGL